jgi:SMI1 / KNR4 family (SUKH-1)
MAPDVEAIIRSLETRPGASEEALDSMLRQIGVQLPEDYLEFLRMSNGAAGEVGETGYIDLWSVEDIPDRNQDSDAEDIAPGLIEIGSNGSSTGYAIDTRSRDPANMTVVQFDLYGLGEGGIDFRVASFSELLRRLAAE